MEFASNRAVLGSALYFSGIGHCTWFSESPPYFNQTVLRDWPIWKFGYVGNRGNLIHQC